MLMRPLLKTIRVFIFKKSSVDILCSYVTRMQQQWSIESNNSSKKYSLFDMSMYPGNFPENPSLVLWIYHHRWVWVTVCVLSLGITIEGSKSCRASTHFPKRADCFRSVRGSGLGHTGGNCVKLNGAEGEFLSAYLCLTGSLWAQRSGVLSSS